MLQHPQKSASSTSTTSSSFPFPREYFFPPFFTRQTNLTTHHAQLTKWAALVLAYCRHHRIFKLSLSESLVAPTTSSHSSSLSTAATNSQQTGSAATTSGSLSLSLGGNHSSSSSTPATAPDLFHNRKISRRLGIADAREVIDFLRRDGRAEYVSRGSGGFGGGDGGGGNNNNNNITGSSSSGSNNILGGGGGGREGGGSGGDVVWIYWRTPEEWAGMLEGWVDETAQKGTVMTLYELTEGDGTRGTGEWWLWFSSFATVSCPA